MQVEIVENVAKEIVKDANIAEEIINKVCNCVLKDTIIICIITIYYKDYRASSPNVYMYDYNDYYGRWKILRKKLTH